METNVADRLKLKLCGRQIVAVEPSKWSGVVRALSNNQQYFSITLDDGTVLEVGSIYIREQPDPTTQSTLTNSEGDA